MSTWTFAASEGNAVLIPLPEIQQLRLMFPAEKIVHSSRGIDRTQYLPTRYYQTPSGQWSTDDPDLLRLLHNDFSFVIERAAKLSNDTEFIATSTNYGSNPYFCIRRPLSEGDTTRLFHLEQEDVREPHYGLSLVYRSDSLHLDAVQVRFDTGHQSATDIITGENLPNDALIFTAPAIVWNGEFVGWENYARATYDCRHAIRLQYADREKYPEKLEQVRVEIQRLQCLWQKRDNYVHELLRLADSVGYAEYERMIMAIGGEPDRRFLLLSSTKGTAEDVATKLITQHPNVNTAFQIAEGGGTGIIIGTPTDWRVVGPSSYRRGRVLCCLLVEMKGV